MHRLYSNACRTNLLTEVSALSATDIVAEVTLFVFIYLFNVSLFFDASIVADRSCCFYLVIEKERPRDVFGVFISRISEVEFRLTKKQQHPNDGFAFVIAFYVFV